MRAQHNVIHRRHFVGRVADRNRARHIRAVTVHDAAKVHGDKIAFGNRLVTGHAMRPRRVRARYDDRIKRHIFRAVQQHQIGQLGRNLLFGRARADIAEHLKECALRDALRSHNVLQFRFGFDHAQTVHHAVHRYGFRGQAVLPARKLRKGQGIVLQRNGFHMVVCDQCIYHCRIGRSLCRLAHVKPLDGCPCSFNVAEIGEKYRAFFRNIGHARGRMETGRIPPVPFPRQQHGVRAKAAHGAANVCNHAKIPFNASTASR